MANGNYHRDSYTESSPVYVENGNGTLVIGGAIAVAAIFGLLYLLTHSLEWSALIMLAAVALLVAVPVIMWVKMQFHKMNMDRAALLAEMQQGPAAPAPFKTKQLGSGSNMAERPVIAGGVSSKLPKTIAVYDPDGKRYEASYAALNEYITTQFPHPKREGQWGLRAEAYGEAARLLCMVDDAPLFHDGRGYEWREGVTQQDMLDWRSDTVKAYQARGGSDTRYE